MGLATWSPFQSDEVRAICAHMTDEERSQAGGRSALYGVWVVASVVAPLGAAWSLQTPWMWTLAALAILTHLVLIPVWQRRVRAFLSSTEWARERGLGANLRLFRFRR
jgi:lysylphosphatidylglycerol synthetase-like protein (DUF2156 family)